MSLVVIIQLTYLRWNHHLLNTISRRPEWLTIKHGAKRYIDAVMVNFPSDRVFLNRPVKSVVNDNSGRLILTCEDGHIKTYDHVILATHAAQALSIISSSATSTESTILSAFHTSPNTVILHSDTTMMPRNSKTWSSWNYLATEHSSQVSLTYNMNKLQHIPSLVYGPVLATLNPLHAVDKSMIQGTFSYTHPLYTPAAMKAQALLPSIQNTRGISYVGAWTKYGFHEDAFTSGISVAVDKLGAKLPFPVVDSTFRRGRIPALGPREFVLRACIQIVQLILGWVEWIAGEWRLSTGRGKHKLA
jgi:predicted NAD/FAD-binding protein